MADLLALDFIQNAIAASILASVACGIIGSLVVVNRMVFLSGGIAHASYGGLGLALFFGFSPILGALGFSLLTSIIIASLTFNKKFRSDTIIGVLWASGMAIGIILTDLTPGYNVDLMSYLFGSLLAVPISNIYIMTGINVLIIFLCSYFYSDIKLFSFDEDYAVSVGVPVKFIHYLVLVMSAMAIVAIIQVVGLILVIALLSIPPYIADKFSKSLSGMMILSIFLSIFFTLTGLVLSFALDLTSGAAIIMTASLSFIIVEIVFKLKKS